jgi:DEAD/DEAH box helicase domain-containing protein
MSGESDLERLDRQSGLRAVLERWRSEGCDGEIAAELTEMPRAARTAPPAAVLSRTLADALRRSGVEAPWSHQARAWELLCGGRDTVVATPTASGKTLCYNAPVLDRLRQDPTARALYMFPTKALARDQLEAVRALAARAGVDARPVVYDGDTPQSERRVARREARILITNPDMLHVGILPRHASWSVFLGGLSHVVVDELHQYRGVFGSHVANVLRRLERVARFHGAAPVFAASSATIGNPRELAQRLTGRRFELVEESGAPTGPRTFVVINPEILDPASGARRSSQRVAARLAADLVLKNVTSLVFCQTRRGVEVVLRSLRERVGALGRDPDRVRGYRGGYLPELRREIETALRRGEVDAVVATNALELGIDVGELDAVVLAGYPGTIAAFHQRSGRAGRRRDPSLSVLVAGSAPIDQFLTREPAYLFESSPEVALVQPDNVEILLAHLVCAAFELPFREGDGYGSLGAADTAAALDCLIEQGELVRAGDRTSYLGSEYPAAGFGLRDVEGRRVVAIDVVSAEPLAEVDLRSARSELHPEAIYQHEGRTYLVESLDLEAAEARVREVEPAYYTIPIPAARMKITEERERRELPSASVGAGDLRVVEELSAFKKVRFGSHENLGYGVISLPPHELDTEGLWIEIENPPARLTGEGGRYLVEGLEALGRAVHHVAAMRLMCDPRDLASAVQTPPPTLFLYDGHAGGVGLSERAFAGLGAILDDALRLIRGCPCKTGCPACVGPSSREGPPLKESAAALAAALAGEEENR